MARGGGGYLSASFTKASSPPSFGLQPAAPLNVFTPLMPNQSNDASLEIQGGGGVMRMDPLTALQVAVKNNVGVHYFQSEAPMNVLFTEEGQMGG